ncbi:ATP-dependent metallopeptidase FtsH/Yme1/Tma family protein [Ruoffia tabacinasalis]|uniref:ATP-dependent metallopeptidase FtsH/Yme1/Tma family protein n=1 Tax=Ruoffia tabacinasalis TaxID=87458 RepID=UPI0030D30593
MKDPKRSLFYYYGIVLLIIIIFNFVAIPWFAQRQVQPSSYNNFLTMVSEGQVSEVQLQPTENKLLFTDSENQAIYKTAMVDDLDLTDVLYEADIDFTGEIIEKHQTMTVQ